jgi:putative RNA 2'-phosphotransferase
MGDRIIATSKFLSLILRHKPEVIGLRLDANGWAEIDEIIRLAATQGRSLTRPLLEEVVATSDKQRFVISEDRLKIRANQGHSISVDLELEPQVPPPVLFHGTATHYLESINAQGLTKRSRQHVHLSADETTALKVGQRHGKPIILKIFADKMHKVGYKFYRSANGVWLTDHVPSAFIERLSL